MAFKGANPKENSTFDEFLKKYHDSLAESMELYTKLVVDVISQDPNQFAAKTEKVQIAAVTVKKVKNPDIKIECVEDKYVLYCLVSGIDPETFGMSQFRLLSVFTQGLQRLKHGVTIPSKGR